MARISLDDIDEFSGQGQGGQAFFGLKDDGNKAVVRFLVENENDVEPVVVHEVKTGDGKYRKVACLRQKGDPLSVCPFCSCGVDEIRKTKVKVYVHLLHYEGTKGPNGWNFTGEQKVKIWERPAGFRDEIRSLMADYQPLYGALLEITRRGKKGDTKTSYNYSIAPNLNSDEFTLTEDDWEFTDATGSIIAEKTAEEMNYYLQNGDFEGAQSQSQNVGVTRRGTTTTQPTAPQPQPNQTGYVSPAPQPNAVASQTAQPSGQAPTRAVGRRGAL